MATLHRFWFRFKGRGVSRLGYGVTAWTQEDAVAILQAEVFHGSPLPPHAFEPDVDISKLDPGHILPNMGSPSVRGIWFPQGFAKGTTS
jgi:hypothetical protein